MKRGINMSKNKPIYLSLVASAVLCKLDTLSRYTYLYLINNPNKSVEVMYWIMVIALLMAIKYLLANTNRIRF